MFTLQNVVNISYFLRLKHSDPLSHTRKHIAVLLGCKAFLMYRNLPATFHLKAH